MKYIIQILTIINVFFILKGTKVSSKFQLKSKLKDYQVCNTCKHIIKELSITKNSKVCDSNKFEKVMCYELYYYLYYFNQDYFFMQHQSLSNLEDKDLCKICSNMNKCNQDECLEMNITNNMLDIPKVFSDKNLFKFKEKDKEIPNDDEFLFENHADSSLFNDNTLLENDNSLYNSFSGEELDNNQDSNIKVIVMRLEKLKKSLSSLLKVNIKSIQYKTILMKYRLNDEMKKNKLVSYPQEEVFNKMKKDMNSRLIIAQNTKEINRLINMINDMKKEVGVLNEMDRIENEKKYKDVLRKTYKLVRLVLEKAHSLYDENTSNLNPKILKNRNLPPLNIRKNEDEEEKEEIKDLEIINEYPKKKVKNQKKKDKEFVHVINDVDDGKKLNTNFRKNSTISKISSTPYKKSSNKTSSLYNNNITKTKVEKKKRTKSFIHINEINSTSLEVTKKNDDNNKIFMLLLNKINDLENKQNFLIKSLQEEKSKNKELIKRKNDNELLKKASKPTNDNNNLKNGLLLNSLKPLINTKTESLGKMAINGDSSKSFSKSKNRKNNDLNSRVDKPFSKSIKKENLNKDLVNKDLTEKPNENNNYYKMINNTNTNNKVIKKKEPINKKFKVNSLDMNVLKDKHVNKREFKKKNKEMNKGKISIIIEKNNVIKENNHQTNSNKIKKALNTKVNNHLVVRNHSKLNSKTKIKRENKTSFFEKRKTKNNLDNLLQRAKGAIKKQGSKSTSSKIRVYKEKKNRSSRRKRGLFNSI